MFMFLYGPPAESATKLLDAAWAAHSAMQRFQAHVVLDAKVAGSHQQTTYDLAVDGQNVLLRMRQPRRAGEDRSDRTYYFTSTKMVAYDSLANESLSRTLPKLDSRLDRVMYVFGSFPDMMQDLLQPSQMKSFFTEMKRLTGWTVTRKNDTIVLARKVAGSKVPALIVLGAARPLVRRMDVGSSPNEIHWSFDYAPGKRVAFTPPSTARRVTAFTVAPEPPHYASREAERVTKAMLDAYARLTVGKVEIEGSGGNVSLSLDGRRLREDSAAASYAYDGKVLTVFNRRTKAFYRGAAIRSTVPDLVADTASGADAFSRQILQRKIPFREAIRPNMKIWISGQVTSPAGPCDILSLEGGGSRVTMFVRRKDHLLEAVMATVVDGAGRTITSSNRRFHYVALGVAPSASHFRLEPRKGQRVLPLPPVKLGALPEGF